MAHPRQDDVEWLDDDGTATPHDDEVLAAGRPPMRRRTRVAFGVLAAAVLAAVVTLAITSDGGRPQATPTTRTVAPPSSSGRPVVVELPSRPPRPALAAIRAAFPKGELTGFSAALAAGTRRDVFTFYNITSGRRLITITLGPPRPGQTDAVFRTATSLEIAQLLGSQRVQIQLRVTIGAPTATDFAAIQRLVQDARLLATR